MKLRTLRSCIVNLLGLAILLTASASAFAQGASRRPITVIYPFPPNAGEAKLRAMYAEASKTLGQTIVTEYRPGAGGRMGVLAVQKSSADGTLLTLATDTALTVAPHASPTFRVQIDKDYVAVHQTYGVALVLTAHSSLPFRDARGWIEYAKANPGKLTFGSQGVGGTSHLNMEKLMLALGIQMTHVPYGATPFQVDLANGTFDMMAFSLSVLVPPINAGRLNGIAMITARRSPQIPNVPTLKESGYDVVLPNWNGIVAAPGTPAEIVNRINAAFNAAQQLPEVVKSFAIDESEIFLASPQAFAAVIKGDYERSGALVHRLGLKVE